MENENTGILPAPTNQEAEKPDEKEKAKNRAEIAALSADLERILENPSQDHDRLDRQSDLLDCLLYTIMRHNLRQDKENGTFSEDALNMALRIQKQSMDTMKASATVNYMHCIASATTGVYPARVYNDPNRALPPPHENDERKEDY